LRLHGEHTRFDDAHVFQMYGRISQTDGKDNLVLEIKPREWLKLRLLGQNAGPRWSGVGHSWFGLSPRHVYCLVTRHQGQPEDE